jgi:hypothetical protein
MLNRAEASHSPRPWRTMGAGTHSSTSSHPHLSAAAIPPKPRVFVLPMPTMEPPLYEAMEAHVRDTYSFGSGDSNSSTADASGKRTKSKRMTLPMIHNERVVLRGTVEHWRRCQDAAREKLERVGRQTEEYRQELVRVKTQQSDTRTKNAEEQQRADFAAAQIVREQAGREAIRQECTEAHEATVRNRKRARQEQEVEQHQQLQPLSATIASNDNVEKAPTDHPESSANASPEMSVGEQGVVLQSEQLSNELKLLQSQVELLTEQRSEMIWLLKEVIKADEKQRIANKNNPETKIALLRQA